METHAEVGLQGSSEWWEIGRLKKNSAGVLERVRRKQRGSAVVTKHKNVCCLWPLTGHNRSEVQELWRGKWSKRTLRFLRWPKQLESSSPWTEPTKPSDPESNTTSQGDLVPHTQISCNWSAMNLLTPQRGFLSGGVHLQATCVMILWWFLILYLFSSIYSLNVWQVPYRSTLTDWLIQVSSFAFITLNVGVAQNSRRQSEIDDLGRHLASLCIYVNTDTNCFT